MLEAAPPQSVKAVEIRRKLQLYRQNRGIIQQRIVTETEALKVLQKFTAVDTQLKTLADRALLGATLHPVGLSEPEYAALIGTLEQSLAGLALQSQGPAHPVYGELAATLEDYRLALKLWRRYIAEHRNDPDWTPTYERVSQRVSLSLDEIHLLTQKYNVKPSLGSTKVLFRFTVWDIWRQGGDRLRKVQPHALGLPIAETASPPP